MGVAVGAGVGVGGGVGCGVGDGVGPVDSTRFTCELRSDSVPALGSLRITVPACLGRWLVVDLTELQVRPRCSVAVASLRVCPIRFGTATCSAPELIHDRDRVAPLDLRARPRDRCG